METINIEQIVVGIDYNIEGCIEYGKNKTKTTDGAVAPTLREYLVEWMLSMDMDKKMQRDAVFGAFGVDGITHEQGQKAFDLLHESEQKTIRELIAAFLTCSIV